MTLVKMLFRAAILSAVMLLGIHKAVGAAVEARDSAVDAVPEIATTACARIQTMYQKS